jgi:hypothetical protein
MKNNLIAHDLVAKIVNITLNGQIDSFIWLQTKMDNLQNNLRIKILLTMLQWYKSDFLEAEITFKD